MKKSITQTKNPPALEYDSARGPGCTEQVLARFAFVDDDEVAAAVAPDAQERDLFVGLLGQANGFVGGLDRLAVNFLDHVARFEAGFGRG